MAVTLVCPTCGARWKIVPSSDSGDKPAKCPNHDKE